MLVLALGTIPYATIGGDTGYVVLMAGLFVRGLGLGGTMMPAMANLLRSVSLAKSSADTAV